MNSSISLYIIIYYYHYYSKIFLWIFNFFWFCLTCSDAGSSMGDQAGRIREGKRGGCKYNPSIGQLLSHHSCWSYMEALLRIPGRVRFKHKDYKISKPWFFNPCRPSKKIEERMANACRLIFAACGTSWHSGLIGKYAIASVAVLDHSASFRLRIG